MLGHAFELSQSGTHVIVAREHTALSTQSVDAWQVAHSGVVPVARHDRNSTRLVIVDAMSVFVIAHVLPVPQSVPNGVHDGMQMPMGVVVPPPPPPIAARHDCPVPQSASLPQNSRQSGIEPIGNPVAVQRVPFTQSSMPVVMSIVHIV